MRPGFFSCLYGQPLAVGRVMTPVLAMTVVREAAIAAFTPEKILHGGSGTDQRLHGIQPPHSRKIRCRKPAGSLPKGDGSNDPAHYPQGKTENPPPLYDLTTLQRDANRLLGYSAQQTLDYVQSLYEKKLTTYPRTDSCYITDDDEEMLEELTEELEGFLENYLGRCGRGCAPDTAHRQPGKSHRPPRHPAHTQYAASRSGSSA